MEKEKLWLIEYYTLEPGTSRGGWDIKHAWVMAETKAVAKEKLSGNRSDFDCIITIEEQAERFPLSYGSSIDDSIFIK